ncbi:uncharacterized protein LOC135162946 [Diachasmimorpha longicaudata]|uniref:uncharacterized protein LOC135162946 n=1 Tax=Diachasmimorpha longicaudata TaxID=58733 RepID=UPI0030B87F78
MGHQRNPAPSPAFECLHREKKKLINSARKVAEGRAIISTMAPRTVKKMLFNSNLFNIDGIPMKFYLEGYDEYQSHQISKIIEAHGGKFSLPDTDTIVFSEPGHYAHTDRRRFHLKCLRDSIVQNKLQDINKYALPWRITQAPKASARSVTPKISKSEIDEKPSQETLIPPPSTRKLRSCSLREPYVLIQDCITTHGAIFKQSKLNNSSTTESQTSRNCTEREQSSVISSSQSNLTPSFVQSKTADKPSPIAIKPRNVAVKRLTNFRSCGLFPRPKPALENGEVGTRNEKRTGKNQRSSPPRSPRGQSPGVEIITEVQKQSPVVKEIIVISDSEDLSNGNAEKNGPKPSKTDLQSPEPSIDVKSLTNFDGPNSYAVWSRAGPPGPPNLSDSDGGGGTNESKVMNVNDIKEEEDCTKRRTRDHLGRFQYYEWYTSDSDEASSNKSRGKKMKKGRKSSYECDRSYRTNKRKTHRYTYEDNKKMIQYLIENGLVTKARQLHTWIKFSIKKILPNPVRTPASLKRHFENALLFDFEKYTDDSNAIEQFTKLRAKST